MPNWMDAIPKPWRACAWRSLFAAPSVRPAAPRIMFSPGGQIWRLSAAALAGLTCTSAANAAELRLTFPGLEPMGRVAYAVYADERAWTRRRSAVESGTSPVGQDVILRLPPGRYAVMAYHDRNGDMKLNTLPIGLPTEPYGFSNDSRGTFGPPPWRAAVFSLGEPGARQALRLR
jgi:uncharacterized protein (DUF2141 family)